MEVIFLDTLTRSQDLLDFSVPCAASVITGCGWKRVCCSLFSQSPKEAAWPQLLIFSHLQDAWWDVEADSWIDWTLLSAQALITTALECCPHLRVFLGPLVSLPLLCLLLAPFSHDFFHLLKKKGGGWGEDRKRSRIANEDRALTELESSSGWARRCL